MTDKEKELARQLAERDRRLAADAEIARRKLEGLTAVAEERSRQRDAARDAETLARAREGAALEIAADRLLTVGLVYRRLLRLEALVTQHEKDLPPEFVLAARAHTRPDFQHTLETERTRDQPAVR